MDLERYLNNTVVLESVRVEKYDDYGNPIYIRDDAGDVTYEPPKKVKVFLFDKLIFVQSPTGYVQVPAKVYVADTRLRVLDKINGLKVNAVDEIPVFDSDEIDHWEAKVYDT